MKEKVPGEIIGGLVYHMKEPMETNRNYKIVASTGFGAYKSNNTFCRNLNSTEICKMEILSFL